MNAKNPRRPDWIVLVLAALGACRATERESDLRFPAGNTIVIDGRSVPVDAPVVLWTMEPYYDAHSESPRFDAAGPEGKRYRPGREARTPELAAAVEREGWTLANLREQVDLLVLHYDACGTSQACFRVLQDKRQLSIHFMLDLDGTIYQTLDLRDTAWHARAANSHSIGVEIAHIGAFPHEDLATLAAWYEWTEGGLRIEPAKIADASLRHPGFEARPARGNWVDGRIHGALFRQPDFTPQQYESLAALTQALSRVFPRIELEVPRDANGAVRTDALSERERAGFQGVLGHYHLQADKRDPGPAFDWERLLGMARRGGPKL